MNEKNEKTTSKFPVENLLKEEDVVSILNSDKTALKVLSKEAVPCEGDLVGVRLNLNILKATGIPIQTIHAGSKSKYEKQSGFFDGEALHYAQAVVLKNAFFNVSQKGRYEILSGINNKFPMASIDGELVSIEPPEEFAGVEIKFNPKLHHLFVDKESEAIKSAEEVVVFGHKAYARGKIEYYNENNMPKPIGDLPSEAKPVKKEFSVVFIQSKNDFKTEEQFIVKKQKKPSFA